MCSELIRSMLAAAHPPEDTTSFDIFDFIHAFGSARDALLYSQLFWPEFKEFEGMVFLRASVQAEDDERRVQEALRTYGGDLRKTEQSFNLLEIAELFGRRSGEATEAEDRCLAEILCEMWRCRLAHVFPTRSFKVEVVPERDMAGSLAITFYHA